MQTLPGCAHKFAAIVSDLTSGNIPYSRRRRFYSLVAEALRPGGTFCDKLLSHPIPHESVAELLAKYENAPLNLDTLNRFNCESSFAATSHSIRTSRHDALSCTYAHTAPGPTVRPFWTTPAHYADGDDMGLRLALAARSTRF